MSVTSPTWHPAYIGLGSNLDGPVGQIESALDRLSQVADTRLVASSHLYRSAPFGGIEQPDFVNAAATILTQLSPRDLLAELKEIEHIAGRDAGGQRWGPRVIDLDLLVYGATVVDDEDLKVPHPGIAERNFVLLPLRELAPELTIPGLGRVNRISVNEQEPRIERVV